MKRVAIVEDNEDNRLLVEVMLEDAYELTFYEDAATALNGLNQSVPDLILIDISLPGMDGLTLLDRMRRIAPELPAVGKGEDREIGTRRLGRCRHLQVAGLEPTPDRPRTSVDGSQCGLHLGVLG